MQLASQVQADNSNEDNHRNANEKEFQKGENQPKQNWTRFSKDGSNEQEQVERNIDTSQAEGGKSQAICFGFDIVQKLKNGEPATIKKQDA